MPIATDVEGIWQFGERFEVMIATDTVTQNLGSFATFEEAREALSKAVTVARDRQRNRLRAAA